MKKVNKVFGIGLSKTGTTSLRQALDNLGYEAAHYAKIHELENDMDVIDAAVDVTTIPIYKQLDKKYPNSKFILTTRNKEDWAESYRNHTELKAPHKLSLHNLVIRKAVYGTVAFDERCLEAFDKHHQDVKQFFSNRADDLLVMNILQGDGYEKLCPFLGITDIPDNPFPHEV